ncbi:transposase [Pseudonocardia sp. C8]|uniref:transposase n=1 Tax=Pseudonocardia sp. C8 TaxID=2762759 RepID=UPI001642DBB4|nr:transposase [Pseudonocardia sp. C8]MBC3190541.1 transposase [Pseudonocardia sp. C8]
MPRARRWTDEQLVEAVAASTRLSEVCHRLGIKPGRYDQLRKHIERVGADASHIPGALDPRHKNHRRRYTDGELAAAVATETSVHGVLRRLGYEPNGGMFRAVTARIRTLGLDTSHFTGRSWARGHRFPMRRARPLSEILVRNSDYHSSAVLRRRLIAEGLKEPRCEECGLAEWRGRPLPLHLDHVNGDHTDNRLENLRILCPNCHAQTDTWCGRKN